MNLKIILIFTMAMVCSCSNPETASETTALDARIDAVFAAYDRNDQPGYAIAVVSAGEMAFARGYGMADVHNGVGISANTAFNLASLSKQFTGAAIAREILSGGLTLDDRLAEHWPDLPEFMSTIEMGHLVYMTSGLAEYYTLPSPRGGWDSENRFTVADAISAVLSSGDLEYEPGTRWTYSNINFQLLAEVAAHRNDSPFADLMTEAFFGPLKMTNSWVDSPLQAEQSTRAVSYVWNEDTGNWRIAPRLSPHYGGSGVFSSLSDLARWDRALYSDRIFGAEFTTLMLATRKYAHDKDNDAFGLVHGNYRGQETLWYEGGDYGASTYMARLPQRDQTVICLSNIGNGGCWGKAQSVIDILLTFDKDADFVTDDASMPSPSPAPGAG